MGGIQSMVIATGTLDKELSNASMSRRPLLPPEVATETANPAVMANPPIVPLAQPPYTRHDLTTIPGAGDMYFQAFWNKDHAGTWPPRLAAAPPYLQNVFTSQEWAGLWTRIEPIVANIKRNERICSASTFFLFWSFSSMGPLILCSLFILPMPLPIDLLMLSPFLLMIAAILVPFIWVEWQRSRSKKALQQLCRDANDKLRRRGVHHLVLDSEYERWLLTTKQGFRLYFIPIAPDEKSNATMDMSTTVSSIRHGQWHIPVGQTDFWTWTSTKGCDVQHTLTTEFDRLGELWSRFWVDWQAASFRYGWIHRATIVLALAVLFVLWGQVIPHNDASRVAVMVLFSMLMLSFVFRALAAARRLEVIGRYAEEFGQKGMFLEHRAVAGDTRSFCCFGHWFVEYLVLSQLPTWSSAGSSDAAEMVLHV